MATGDAPMTHPVTTAQASAGDAELVKRLRDEIERLQDRLEMRHAWQIIGGVKTRVTVEAGSIPDGIECRDETIKQLDANIETLRSRLTALEASAEKMREALQKIADLPLAKPVRTSAVFDSRGKHVGYKLEEPISLAEMEGLISNDPAASIARAALAEGGGA